MQQAVLGTYLLLFALIAAIYATVAGWQSDKRQDDALLVSARNALLITWPLMTLAVIVLAIALVTSDFTTTFVWAVTETTMPTYLRLTAMWGGQAGSLVFWGWLLTGFVAGAMILNWKKERELMPYVITVSGATVIFFLLLVTFWENPFAQYYQTPAGEVQAALFAPSALMSGLAGIWADLTTNLPGALGVVGRGVVPFAPPEGSRIFMPAEGQGLNPLLRHPGMIIHPPMLYLGFVGFVVPFAFGMSALITGKVNDTWMDATRGWTLVAWLFLSLGLILGGWWAYDVLGWGGYWAWDPVENASLLPWLTGTAFLHSVMIQEKRGMLRRWNMILVIMTYLLVILGTFATRSGIVSSVHSFAQSAIGPLFFVFLAIMIIWSATMLMKRWHLLEADHKLDSLLSRETAFLVNNLIFISITLTVGIATYWPVFTEILAEFTAVEKSSLGPEFYNRTTGPMFAALLLLMGIAPLLAWKRASMKRLGSSIMWPAAVTVVILGVLYITGVTLVSALIGLGLAILAGTITLFEYFRGAQARVNAHGESYPVAFWRLLGRNRRRYGGYMIHLGVVIMAIGIISSTAYQLETQQPLSPGQQITLGDYVLEYETLERFIATDGRAVTRAVTTVYHNGEQIGTLNPRVDNYPSGQPMSIPGKIMSPLGDDFYVLLVTWEQLDMSSATFKVYYNPLVNWIWGGSFIFIVGTFIAAWPTLDRVSVKRARRIQRTAPAAGD